MDEFQIASTFCASEDPQRRELGADILGQLGWAKRTFLSESVAVLIGLLSDTDLSVVYSAAMALGHRQDPLAISPLCMLVDHPDPDIRKAIAYALGGFNESAAIDAEILLSKDIDRDVRDWATFTLGSLADDVDTVEVREALFARMKEEDGEIRGEALVGLARRGDDRTLGLVQRELATEFAGSWVLEAAELLADASLVAPLRTLRDSLHPEDEGRFHQEIEKALAACELASKT